MKKTLAVLALAALSICSGFAQGSVNFNNTATTFGNDGVDRFVYNVDGVTRLVGPNYAAALYFGNSADAVTTLATSASNPTLEGSRALFRATTTTLPGTWSGSSRLLPGTTAGSGATVFMQVRVWDTVLFASYEAAKQAGGITGASEIFSYRISTSPTPAPSELVMANLRSFALVVPEPSTIALGILGLGSLLLFRRKK